MSAILRRPVILDGNNNSSETDDNEGLQLPGAIAVSGQLQVTLTGGRVDNYNPSGIDAASGLDAILTADTTLTGIVSDSKTGRLLLVYNRDLTYTLTLAARDSNSFAANWFSHAADLVLRPGEGCLLWWEPAVVSPAINAGWALVSSYGADEVRGIAVQIGDPLAGTPFPVGTEFYIGKSPKNYKLAGWQNTVAPDGGLTLEIQRSVTGSWPTFSTMSGTSTSTGGAIDNGLHVEEAASADLGLWSSIAISQGDHLKVKVLANTGAATFFSLLLLAKRG